MGASRFPVCWVVAFDGWVVGWCFRRLYKFPFSSFVPCCSHSLTLALLALSRTRTLRTLHIHIHSCTHTHRESFPPTAREAGNGSAIFFVFFRLYILPPPSFQRQRIHTTLAHTNLAAQRSRAEQSTERPPSRLHPVAIDSLGFQFNF